MSYCQYHAGMILIILFLIYDFKKILLFSVWVKFEKHTEDSVLWLIRIWILYMYLGLFN